MFHLASSGPTVAGRGYGDAAALGDRKDRSSLISVPWETFGCTCPFQQVGIEHGEKGPEMSFMRGFLPRPIRPAIHPIRSTTGSMKRKVTPKVVRKVHYYARHPVGTATTAAGRKVRMALFR
jgi:hypothetical protein